MLAEFPRGLEPKEIGSGVGFLAYTALDAIRLHANLAWFTFPYGVPAPIVWIITFFFIYYLTMGINRIDVKFYDLKPVTASSLSNLLIIQFVALLPLFAGLSCDFGRVVIYWTLSALCIYGLFNEEELSCLPRPLQRFSEKSTAFFNRARFFRSNRFFIVVSLCIGVSVTGCSFAMIIQSSVVGQLPLVAVKFCEYVLGYDIHIMD
jgi:hypothetical protein